jgi:ankyrin repeat protein
MAAAAAEMLILNLLDEEAELRQWVEANPGRINDRDSRSGLTPLLTAIIHIDSVSLVVWLLDEKGADVNACTGGWKSALHYAFFLDIFIALLDRGADPILPAGHCEPPLMSQAQYGTVDNVAHLLQDPRVRASINVRNGKGLTALHYACNAEEVETVAAKVMKGGGGREGGRGL